MAQHNFHAKILFWNANSIHDKLDELYHLMTIKHIHIACISETFLKPHHKLTSHDNFVIHRNDRIEGRGGGVAIIIKKEISHKILPHTKTSLIENISVEISDDKNKSFIVSSIYLPGGTSHNLIKQHYARDLRKLTNYRKPYYLCGDLNSRHRYWNCFNSNQAGNILYDEHSKNNFLIKHSNDFTYFPSSARGNPSTLDLLITNGLHDVSDLNCIPLSSDHLGVVFKVLIGEKFKSTQIKATYNFNLADWNCYRKTIHHHSLSLLSSADNITTTNDIDELINNFTNLIKIAREKSIPTTTKSKQTTGLPEKILDIIKMKNTLRKQWQTTRDPFIKSLINHYEKTIKSLIRDIKNEEYHYKLSKIPPSHLAVWQAAKLIKNDNHLPPLICDNETLTTPKQKAEALGELFYKNHCNPFSNDSPAFTTYIDNIVKLPLTVDFSTINFADDDEIISHIRNLKNKKSPGLDDVQNSLIKCLPSRGIKVICLIINSCLKLSYFPQIWKTAKIVPIHKHGKPKNDVNSYRPISLLCVLSKLLEKVLLSRINHHLQDNNILPDEQHGFRQNHSTTKQLHKMIHLTRENLSVKKSTGMLMLDIEKAFDRVWHNGLIFKFTSLLFPSYLINMVKQFLSERKFYVNVSDQISSVFNIPFGVPQGAVLSPTLYNIYTYDLPKSDSTNMYLFADDISFHSTHRNIIPIQNALTSHAKQIQAYTRKWKIKINGDKTQAIFVSNRRKKQIPKKEINVFNSRVKWSNEVKYLGFIIDKRLTVSYHVDYLIRKVNAAVNLLYPLLNSKSCLCIENKLLIYKTAIRPIFCYASPAFIELIANKHKKKLQILQNKVLKLIFGVERRTSTIEIHEKAKVPMVEEFNFKLLNNFKLKHNIL